MKGPVMAFYGRLAIMALRFTGRGETERERETQMRGKFRSTARYQLGQTYRYIQGYRQA